MSHREFLMNGGSFFLLKYFNKKCSPRWYLPRMMMEYNKKIAEVTIIGAGIVGINTALQLQRKGHSTVLIDRSPPIMGCSSGNAGVLAGYGVTPVSLPGLWKQVPKMLFDPMGPLSLRREHLLKITPWLFKFWKASKPATVQKSAKALESLVQHSLRDYKNLTRGTPAERLVKASPVLCVYNNRSQYERDQYVWDLRKKYGVRWSLVEANDLKTLEPALADSIGFAVALENSGFTLDPQQLGKELFEEYMRHGGSFLQTEIKDIGMRSGKVHLQMTEGDRSAEKLVICCGAWSGILARRLGEPVPLEAERGYHITLSDFEGLPPRHPIMSPAHKVIATPMAKGLRIAGMVEFGGFLPPDYRRSAILRNQLAQLFPQVKSGISSSWMGHRPTLPDSLPVISRSKKHASVFYAFGHQHIGLTGAPMTAQLIVDLVTESTPTVDIAPFRIDRF